MSLKTQSIIDHLLELRKRIINCLITVLLFFLFLICFSNNIYIIIASPLIKKMPPGTSMISTDLSAPFFVPVKLTVFVSFFLSAPIIIYQFWQFIAPALYNNEKKIVFPILFTSICLFYIGVIFSYFFILPFFFHFIINNMPTGIKIATDIEKYLDFITSLFLIFGSIFEVPIVIVILCWAKVLHLKKLKKKRSYFFLSSFIISIFLTPPDIISQTFLAIFIYLLFELGILFAYFFCKNC
ncbi:twin-arginine translocase subunit TatC [Candidatus Tachikawaea gelatinosa]|uniref:Sec-independent protein translocase protein TatC n=1 Tax=Candidatus Tachikawaea gelatinosa TaxID=1410383 RepID=A0A090AR88_9ENTR|nr:twin-arginine translocase subunit TatC [Candidatus Tachikawaea gelatinosa]BAP58285.1 twin-arginine translocase subunit sec-independent protein export [Candidatus Tachikawaea gelatinosa]